MRIFVTLLFVSTVAGAAALARTVDLNAPGALESLRTENPEHYAKVTAILDAAESPPPNFNLAPWIESRFNASDAEYVPLWRVSDPPKLKVSFTLEHTRYTAIVVPRLRSPKLVPLR